MKRPDLFFAAILVPVDYVMLLVAGWLAYSLRFNQVAEVRPVLYTLPFNDYFQLVLAIAVVWLAVLALAGAYPTRERRLSGELGRIMIGVSAAVLLSILVIFFRREYFSSRFIIIASWALAIVGLWLSHSLIRGLQAWLLRRGWGQRPVVVVGKDATTGTLVEAFHIRPQLGFQVVKTFAEVNLETLTQIQELVKNGGVEEVLMADPSLPRAQAVQLLDLCQEHGIIFRYAADPFDAQAGRIDIQDYAGIPVFEIRHTPLEGWGRIIKRLVDVVGSTIGITILFIPGLIVAILIKLDSAGPIFFRGERVGQGQRKFYLWKFRSMIRDAHVLKDQLRQQNERSDGPLFKITNDPRITRMGRFIIKTSIYEFPQLFNVFRGDMSLVGPRPHEPGEVARYEKWHKKLLAIKPGMTGMAQVSGRSNLSFEEEARLDIYYIERWSLGLDMQILLRTPAAVFNTKTAA